MTIDDYLADLERQLRARRAPSARLLREVEDHLTDLVDELIEGGIGRGSAEARAVARFGAAAAVAARFAASTATTAARRAVQLGAVSFVGYVAVFVLFASAASPLLRDFPQGAASFFALQFAIVALSVAAVRSVRWRAEAATPAAALAALTRAVALATGALFVAAVAEVTVALTRPAGFIAWAEARWLVVAFGASLFVIGASAIASIRAAAQARAVRAFPDCAAIAPTALVADDIAELVARRRLPNAVARGARAFVRRPWPLTLALAAVAFVAVTGAGGGTHASRLGGAAALGLLEAVAILAGFACCGRLLGLRPGPSERERA